MLVWMEQELKKKIKKDSKTKTLRIFEISVFAPRIAAFEQLTDAKLRQAVSAATEFRSEAAGTAFPAAPGPEAEVAKAAKAAPNKRRKRTKESENEKTNEGKLPKTCHLDRTWFLWKWFLFWHLFWSFSWQVFDSPKGKSTNRCCIDRKRKLFAASTGFWIVLVYNTFSIF